MGVGTIKRKALFYGALILKNAKKYLLNEEIGLPTGVIPNKYGWYFSFSM
ncbi:hypothetical protein HpCK6_12790 [Helicobacter pylori]